MRSGKRACPRRGAFHGGNGRGEIARASREARGFPRWKRRGENSASVTRDAGLSTVERVEGKQRERHARRGDFHGGNGRAENSASLTRGAEVTTVERVEGKQRERHAGRGDFHGGNGRGETARASRGARGITATHPSICSHARPCECRMAISVNMTGRSPF